MPIPNLGGTGGDAGSRSSFSSSSGGGGSSSSGSSSGSGAPATPAPGTGAAALQSSQMYDVVRQAADRTEYGPPVPVGPNDQVYVIPRAGNTVTAFISTQGNSDAKQVGGRLQVTTTSNPILVGVRTLREIGVYSPNPGEGVTILHVRKP